MTYSVGVSFNREFGIGLDLEDELTKIMSDGLGKHINAEIIKSLGSNPFETKLKNLLEEIENNK